MLLLLVALGFFSACMQDADLAIEKTEDIDPLVGAWGNQTIFRDQPVDVVVLFTPTHQVAAWFDSSTGALVHSNGGLWSRTGNHVTETVEFDSDRPERVGTDVSFDIELTGDSLTIVGTDSWLTRIDGSDENKLEGGWEMVELKQDGSLTTRASESRLVRMMSSSRFQEIEYEPESGVILSLTGGSYRIDEESYVETTLFSMSKEAVHGQVQRFAVERDEERWRQMGPGQPVRVWKQR